MNNEFVKQNADVLLLLILTEEKFNLLPEFLKIFDVETFFKFLEIFAGATFNVPSKERLLKMYRDIHVWSALSNKGKGSVDELAELYSLDKNSLYSIKTNMDAILKQNKDLYRKLAMKI